MNSFKWGKHFETGITSVDEEHYALVGIINRLSDKISTNEMNFDDYSLIITELLDYTKYHFESEEKMMLESGIDGRHFESHVKKHIDFVQEIVNINSTIKFIDMRKLSTLLDLLVHWLAYHILVIDQNMSAQIEAIESGVSAKEAYDEEERKSANSVEPLLEALNDLVSQLSHRNEELVELNSSLENKVQERTQELVDINKSLEEISLTDSLTRLSNRRRCIRELSLFWDESTKKEQPLSCIMIDIDYFKEINDTYGHAAGDKVLCEFSQELLYSVRSDDLVCRLGGDEFFVLCGNTDQSGVRYLANKIHENISNLRVKLSHATWSGSASIGVATKLVKMKSYEELVKLADESVYKAKESGRNCVRG